MELSGSQAPLAGQQELRQLSPGGSCSERAWVSPPLECVHVKSPQKALSENQDCLSFPAVPPAGPDHHLALWSLDASPKYCIRVFESSRLALASECCPFHISMHTEVQQFNTNYILVRCTKCILIQSASCTECAVRYLNL